MLNISLFVILIFIDVKFHVFTDLINFQKKIKTFDLTPNTFDLIPLICFIHEYMIQLLFFTHLNNIIKLLKSDLYYNAIRWWPTKLHLNGNH